MRASICARSGPSPTMTSRHSGSDSCSAAITSSKQQRVLLAIKPAHAQHASYRPSGPSERLRLVDHVGGGDERDRQLEQSPCVRVALGQVRADDGDRQPTRERAEHDLKDVRGNMHPQRVRVSRSHIAREILAHPQHDSASPNEREQGEADRVDVGPEEPDGIDAVEHSPESKCGPVSERNTCNGCVRLV